MKNFGMIEAKDYVGKTFEEATQIAKDNGFKARIVEKDGDSYILTMDYKTDRLNFRIRNNIVIDVHGG